MQKFIFSSKSEIILYCWYYFVNKIFNDKRIVLTGHNTYKFYEKTCRY